MYQMNISIEFKEFIINKIVYKEPSVFGPRLQTHWQLIYVEEGEMLMEVEGVGACRVRSGEAVVSLPGNRETFRFAEDGPTRHGWVEAKVDPVTEPELLDSLRVLPFPEVLWGMVEVLGRCADGRGRVVTPLGRDVAEALFAACLDPQRIRGPVRRPIHPAVEAAQRLMRKAYAEPLGLTDLAAEAGVTPAHLIRLYRRELGRTPQRELTHFRLQRAEAMLLETGWTVAEIAHRCGFADPPHFSRCFRAERGLPPGRFRKQRWAGIP